MNNEQRLISKIITEKTLRPVNDRGVTPLWFFDADQKAVFEWLIAHHAKYGNIPSKTTVKHQWGSGYVVAKVPETFDYILDEMAKRARWAEMSTTLLDMQDLLNDGDIDDALSRMEVGINKTRGFSPVATHLVDSMDDDRLDERWEEYDKRKTSTGLIGYSTGFPTIDTATLGLQPGQLITVVGQAKAGKTSISLAISNHVYVEHKVSILFVSFEMGIRELEIRQEALMAGISFARLQQGALLPHEEKTYDDWLTKAQTHYDWPFRFMDISSGGTLSAIEAQIERHEPGLVVVDGIYMMTDEVTGESNSWEALTNITRGMKRLATRRGVPIIINSQALRSKSKGERLSTDSAGYSSSFGQDSDVMLGVERVQPGAGEDETTHAYERILKILASRNSGLAQVDLVFDYDEGRICEL